MAGSNGRLGRIAQPAKFLAVGAAGYVANLLLFAGLYGLGTPYIAGSVLSYLAANALMYLGTATSPSGSDTTGSGVSTFATCSSALSSWD